MIKDKTLAEQIFERYLNQISLFVSSNTQRIILTHTIVQKSIQDQIDLLKSMKILDGDDAGHLMSTNEYSVALTFDQKMDEKIAELEAIKEQLQHS